MPDEPPTAGQPWEANEADRAEQRLDVPEPDAEEPGGEPVPDDVDPADAAEQHRDVPMDEDDYR